MRIDDGYLITPTNSSLGRLDPTRIAKLDDTIAYIMQEDTLSNHNF